MVEAKAKELAVLRYKELHLNNKYKSFKFFYLTLKIMMTKKKI